MKDRDREESRNLQPDKPDTPEPSDLPEEFRDQCETDRSKLTPRQTSDCTGARIAEEYQQDEDGGT